MQPARRPFGYEPYVPPGFEGRRPAVIAWFRVYAAVSVLFPLAYVAFWAWANLTSNHPTASQGTAVYLVTAVICLVLVGFFLVAALVPYKPWGWTIGLVAICLGLSSCLVVVTVPLLVFWLKPETKAAFGRL